ncbi:hypothetical protein OROHE_025070 [Orobanche hederae]
MKIKGFFLRQILSSSRIKYESLFLPNSRFLSLSVFRCLCTKSVSNGQKMNVGLGNINGLDDALCLYEKLSRTRPLPSVVTQGYGMEEDKPSDCVSDYKWNVFVPQAETKVLFEKAIKEAKASLEKALTIAAELSVAAKSSKLYVCDSDVEDDVHPSSTPSIRRGTIKFEEKPNIGGLASQETGNKMLKIYLPKLFEKK